MDQPLLLFVCTGNICRSPLLEALARRQLERAGLDQHYQVGSAGLIAWPGSPASPEMQQVAHAAGLDLSAHRARRLNAYLLDEARLVLAMTGEQQQALLAHYPEFAARITTLGQLAGGAEDVADPFGRDLASYRRCQQTATRLLDAAWSAILERLIDPI